MNKHCKKTLIALGISVLSVTAFADDPIEQLLHAQAVFNTSSSSSSHLEIDLTTASYGGLDTLDVFLQNEVNTSVIDADPLGNLISGEGVFSTSDARQSVVTAAFNYLNTPYLYGGNNDVTGFDCSGLVRAVFLEAANTSLPRTAATQAASTTTIKRSELQPGDLVFFNTVGRRKFSHVGIYVGDNKFIHAPRTGAQVRIENININYWNSRFTGARRVEIN